LKKNIIVVLIKLYLLKMTTFNKNAPVFKPVLVQDIDDEEFEEEVELLIIEEELKRELQEDEDEELRKKLALFEKEKAIIFTEWTAKDYEVWKASQSSQSS